MKGIKVLRGFYIGTKLLRTNNLYIDKDGLSYYYITT